MKIGFNQTHDLHLLHPVTDEPLFADEANKKPMIAVIYGSHTKQYRKYINEIVNIQSNEEMSEDDKLDRKIELTAGLVKEFKNLDITNENDITFDGKDILGALDALHWVFTQVNLAVPETKLFYQA